MTREFAELLVVSSDPIAEDRLRTLLAASGLQDGPPRVVYAHHRAGLLRRLTRGWRLPGARRHGQKVVVVFRDPRDVVVAGALVDGCVPDDATLAREIRHRRRGIRALVRVYNLWRERWGDDPRCLWIRFDDLVEDPAETLERLRLFVAATREGPLPVADESRTPLAGEAARLASRCQRALGKGIGELDPFYGYSAAWLSWSPEAYLHWPKDSMLPAEVRGRSLLLVGAEASRWQAEALRAGAASVTASRIPEEADQPCDFAVVLGDLGEESAAVNAVRRLGGLAREWLLFPCVEDPARTRRLLSGRAALFARVEGHAGHEPGRRRLAAQRRRIDRLVVIAGASGAGKSTLVERLASGRASTVAEGLGLDAEGEIFPIESRYFPHLFESHLKSLVYHRDIMRPFLREGGHALDEGLDLMLAADRLVVATLWCEPRELHRRLSARLADPARKPDDPDARERKRLILEEYADPARVRRHYEAWFDFLATVSAETFVILTHGEPRMEPQEQWLARMEWGAASHPRA